MYPIVTLFGLGLLIVLIKLIWIFVRGFGGLGVRRTLKALEAGDVARAREQVKKAHGLVGKVLKTVLLKEYGGRAAAEKALEKDMAEQKAKADSAKAAAAAAEAAKKKDGSGIKVHWIPLAICGAVAVGGGVMAAVFNSKAKSESEKDPMNNEEYNDHHDKIKDAQLMRTIGISMAVVGAIGAGVTFLF